MASAAQTIGILSALATLALYAVWFIERRRPSGGSGSASSAPGA